VGKWARAQRRVYDIIEDTVNRRTSGYGPDVAEHLERVNAPLIDHILRLAVSILPVLLFLLALHLLDSYKLVRGRALCTAILMGALVALVSLPLNVLFMRWLSLDRVAYARYGAPLVEETLKGAYVYYLVRSRRVGFVVDAAICGFAVGAGFAVVENLYYIQALGESRVVIWLVRGFGTAIMHGGTAAIFGIMTKSLFDRSSPRSRAVFVPGLAVAVLLHSFYNHFVLSPIVSTVLIHFTLPLVILVVFYRSEQATRRWLGSQFDVDTELLEIINSGRVSDSPLGMFFRSIRETFPPEVVVDMLCALRLHVELGIHAKGILLMREAGLDPRLSPDVKSKLTELRHLQRSIGKTGQLAIHPLLHSSSRDVWQLTILGER
jgi:RsiW-degrading membrane proteinase PrsW (M82 family)